MSTIFTINFRREAHERELARARARMIALGAWVAYFGLMVVILGLYGLNALAFSNRVAMLERQAARSRQQGESKDWTLGQGELATIADYAESLQRNRDRLRRLGQLLPPNVRLKSVNYNPDNLSGIGTRKLVITGVLRADQGQDRMKSVVGLASSLSADSLFHLGFRTVKLASTSVPEGAGPAEFTIECQ